MVIILTSGGHLEFLCMWKKTSYDKDMQTCFFGVKTIYLIANLNIYLVFFTDQLNSSHFGGHLEFFKLLKVVKLAPGGLSICTSERRKSHQILGSAPLPLDK